MGKKIDLTGQRFGRLVVIEEDEPRRYKKSVHTRWKCKCDCGNESVIDSQSLRSKKTKSCGCLNKEKSRERGTDTIHKANSAAYDVNSVNSWVEGTSINSLIQKTPSDNTSGVKGVWWNKARNKWVAELKFKGQRVLLKSFINKRDAIQARKEAEEKYFKPILEKYGKESN